MSNAQINFSYEFGRILLILTIGQSVCEAFLAALFNLVKVR